MEATYKDGKHDGLIRMWHENGQLKMEAPYKDGKEDGPVRFWDENGELL